MTTENANADPKVKNRVGSLLGALGLGMLLTVMGSLFCYLMVVGFERAIETREWTELPMVVTSSEVFDQRIDSGPREYKPIVKYAYTYEGRPMEGEGVKRTEGFTRHVSKAQRVVDKYPVGMEGTVWVNPENPKQTVLKHNTKAVLYTAWFPGLFVVAGLGIAIGGIRGFLRSGA